MPLSKERNRERMKAKRVTGCTKREIETSIRWRQEHLEAVKAGSKLRYTIKQGHIIKPDHCVQCHRKAGVTGHHQNYTKPLEVLWLCSSCHRKLHLCLENKQRTSSNPYANPLLQPKEVDRRYSDPREIVDADGNLIPEYE